MEWAQDVYTGELRLAKNRDLVPSTAQGYILIILRPVRKSVAMVTVSPGVIF